MSEKIEFLASIPPIQSALKYGGDGSVRIQLDIPKSERANTVGLIALDGVVLKVTIEVAPDKQNGSDNGQISTGTKRQSRWATTEG